MGALAKSPGLRSTAALVRQRVERGGEKLWQFGDFHDLPFEAVAKALSRLTQEGLLQRLSKGVYYHSRNTTFGKSRPSPTDIQRLIVSHTTVLPAGLAAANLLGFSSQTPGRPEVATSANSLPRKLIGDRAIVHVRRPQTWDTLSETNAAFLDFLRDGGRTSELSPEQTVRRALSLAREPGRFEGLAKAAWSEPPRVRAMLGAIGQQLRKDRKILQGMRATLNPLSRFDFGLLSGLRYASLWQAKEKRTDATVRAS